MSDERELELLRKIEALVIERENLKSALAAVEAKASSLMEERERVQAAIADAIQHCQPCGGTGQVNALFSGNKMPCSNCAALRSLSKTELS